MANELTVNATLAYDDGLVSAVGQVVDRIWTLGARIVHKSIQTIATTTTPVDVGGISDLGVAFFRNLDITNYVEVRVSGAGAVFALLRADLSANGTGGIALLELGAGVVPYMIANTASCRVEIVVCSR